MPKENKIPYYFRISETIRTRIESKEYEPGALIPSQKELVNEFGVSNITIRKALDVLVRDGLVVRKQGIGTRVVHRKSDPLSIRVTGNFQDWFNSVSGKYPKLNIEVLEISNINCPENIRKLLLLPIDEQVWRVKRIRKYNGEPISYYINYCRVELLKRPTKSLFQKRSFLKVIQEVCGPISKVQQRVKATIADMDLSSILGINFGYPMFFCEIVYYDLKEIPVEVTHAYFRGDCYTYNNTITLA